MGSTSIVLPRHDRLLIYDDGRPDGPTQTFINVLPNPSNGPVAIAVQLPEGSEGGLVRVVDPLGRLLLQQQFNGSVQLIELDTRGLSGGVYAAEVEADGVQVGVSKFEIIR